MTIREAVEPSRWALYAPYAEVSQTVLALYRTVGCFVCGEQPLVEKAALVQATNEAWIMVAVLTVAALLCMPFAKVVPQRNARMDSFEA
jgi:hypothetical protein